VLKAFNTEHGSIDYALGSFIWLSINVPFNYGRHVNQLWKKSTNQWINKCKPTSCHLHLINIHSFLNVF